MVKHENQLLTEEQEAQVRENAKRRPDDSRPRIRLALHCWRKGELVEGLEWVDEVLALQPGNITAYRIRANILSDMRQTAKAVETALRAREVAPQSAAAHMLLVRMLLADLQPDKAQEALDVALALPLVAEELEQLKVLQKQILAASRQSEQNPLDWITRKFNQRRANVRAEAATNAAREEGDPG